jgi:hypothetical protein
MGTASLPSQGGVGLEYIACCILLFESCVYMSLGTDVQWVMKKSV